MTEEQIKQKAEEYARSKHKERLSRWEQIQVEDVENAFIDGYHECEKEREWNYVKNGDLPVDTDEVLVCLISDEIVMDCYHSNTGWENCLNDEVIAWKEIVPPKEIE